MAGQGTLLLCGYYGEHNLGDDALLQVLLQQLPPGWLPLVTAHDQEQVRRRFGVASTDRRSLKGVLQALAGCQGLVLGGGSLLQDSTSFRSLLYYATLIVSARLQGKPVLLWGQGLGPLKRRRSRLLVRALLPLVSACSWRDSDSATQASEWGVRGLLGSDPVWALNPRSGPAPSWQGTEGPIVLCWRPTDLLQGQAWRPYLEALDRLAAAQDRPVLWMSFHQEQDRGLLEHLQRQHLLPPGLQARSRELPGLDDPDAALDVFRGASLVIAMRLHGLILAALAGAPCAALSYDPKVAAAAGAIGCVCQSLEAPPDPSLPELWMGSLGQPPDPDRLTDLRRQALLHQGVFAALSGREPVGATA